MKLSPPDCLKMKRDGMRGIWNRKIHFYMETINEQLYISDIMSMIHHLNLIPTHFLYHDMYISRLNITIHVFINQFFLVKTTPHLILLDPPRETVHESHALPWSPIHQDLDLEELGGEITWVPPPVVTDNIVPWPGRNMMRTLESGVFVSWMFPH